MLMCPETQPNLQNYRTALGRTRIASALHRWIQLF
jgi:hypothetical protein